MDERAGSSHALREHFTRSQPVHVSIRMADHVWNLRSERSYLRIDAAVRGAQKAGFSVVHFTILGNHLHLIIEADGPGALASGMRSLSIRLARSLNAMMGRRGKVFADRFHAHVLRTPAEVANALRYVLRNFESHAERRGERLSTKGWVDPFSSSSEKQPRAPQLRLFAEPAGSDARSWLLRNAARWAGRR